MSFSCVSTFFANVHKKSERVHFFMAFGSWLLALGSREDENENEDENLHPR
jgi:hypothetical protein